ncbi:phage major tail tube protein [Lentisphaerota bacterium WC36G]|nr:phage major tail tube protein [Lentisphaerae bacterium WC36]
MKILKNMNMFIEGKGFQGEVDEMTPPKIALKVEEIMAGGMGAPLEIETGLEKLEASYSIIGASPEALSQFAQSGALFRFKGAQKNADGTVQAIDIEMRGLIKELDMGNWKPREKVMYKQTFNVEYYKFTLAGQVIYEIDIKNMKCIINGKDVWAEERAAIGV